MFAVPVGVIGVVAILRLTSTSFSLQAYIGVIMLAGIVVSNAILLVPTVYTLFEEGFAGLRRGAAHSILEQA